jgi:hypothetical protein
MAGLVPAISFRRAQRPPDRDRRDKPGDDKRSAYLHGFSFFISSEVISPEMAKSE